MPYFFQLLLSSIRWVCDVYRLCFSNLLSFSFHIFYWNISFETENGIFAQEAGKASGKDETGTSGEGWYQYIGDDGKVYRVEYEVGPQGFIPKVSESKTIISTLC